MNDGTDKAAALDSKPKVSALVDAYESLSKAHAILKEELFMLGERLHPVLFPIEPEDKPSPDKNTTVMSETAAFIYNEVDQVSNAIQYIRQLKNRLEV